MAAWNIAVEMPTGESEKQDNGNSELECCSIQLCLDATESCGEFKWLSSRCKSLVLQDQIFVKSDAGLPNAKLEFGSPNSLVLRAISHTLAMIFTHDSRITLVQRIRRDTRKISYLWFGFPLSFDVTAIFSDAKAKCSDQRFFGFQITTA